jgi:polar amino acid transport system substrate-binding protein
MSEKWFGNRPSPDQAEVMEFPGYGPPDLPGYDATPQNPRC